MSIVSDFVKSMANQAFPAIGAEPVVVGTVTLECILAETNDTKDFDDNPGGFEVSKSLTAVCRTSELPAESILKKTATARGLKFRVEELQTGATFATITLNEIQKG